MIRAPPIDAGAAEGRKRLVPLELQHRRSRRRRGSSCRSSNDRSCDDDLVVAMMTWSLPSVFPLMVGLAQYGERLRAWQGLRVLGALLIIVLVLAIIYLVKQIVSK
jgi:hypothetical protein